MKKEFLKEFILTNNADGILLINKFNRFWFCEIESSFAYVFMNDKQKVIYITDSRYVQAAQEQLKNENATIWCINNGPNSSLMELISKAMKELEIKTLLIEKDYINLDQYEMLQKYNIKPVESSWMRSIKTNDEIKKLQKAADIIVDVLNWVFSWIKPGYSEKEVAKQISIKILELGASGNSFDPIVAAGKNGSMPHHQPSDYIIQDGDMVTIDLGCVYEQYTSDMTRTIVVGNKCNCSEMIDIYEHVQKAQLLGIEKATLNTHTSDVDKACRDYINNSKYKGYFNHGTGHGVGVQVHEKPVVSIGCDTILKNNQVITIEPGIYVENLGGVRIEDTIVINDNKPLILTNNISKELKYINNK